MDEFPGLLAKDFGFRPQGKSAPMAASKGNSGGTTTTTMNFGIGSDGEIRSSSSNRGKSNWNSTPIGNSFLDDQGGIFGSSGNLKAKDHGGLGDYDDVFGGPPKYSSGSTPSPSSFDYDSIFQKDLGAKSSSSPKYDKPVYDDDIFDGVPGLKSSSSVKYDDVFSSISSPPKKGANYDDLLGNLGGKEPEIKSTSRQKSGEKEKNVSSFDDLIPGFGGSSPMNRMGSESSGPHKATAPSSKSPSSVIEDPFVVLESSSAPTYSSSGLFTEPLEQSDKPNKSGSTKADVVSSMRGGIFDDMDPLSGLAKFSSDMNNRAKDGNHSKTGTNMPSEEPTGKTSAETAESVSRKKAPGEDYHGHQTLFDRPTVSSDSDKAFSRNDTRPYTNASPTGTNSQVMSPKSEDNSEASDDVWLTVSEIPLFTQPTSALPPSRPPPRPVQASKTVRGSYSAVNSKKTDDSSFRSFNHTSRRPEAVPDSANRSGMSSLDELEDFAMGRHRSNADEHGDALSSEEDIDANAAAASAAAMKEAMDRAEAKFKQAREVRERENSKVVKNRGNQPEKDEKVVQDAQERELREKQETLDREHEQMEREEKEREQRKLVKERERAREMEKEREKARQAVERATKEARERAAAEARQRAERVAVEKAKAEARERAERAAVQRAHAEARERAATEARERAERAAAEAKERANAEAREKAAAVARSEEARRRTERAAADRAAAEARERAAAEAREKAAAAAAGRGSQPKNENDLESFFGMGARPSSVPRSRTTTSDSSSHPQFHNRAGPEGTQWSSAGSSSGIRKASSATNIVDDLSSIFGAMPSSGDFQDIEGETEERRRARLERHQRTQERAKKALAEKNERDLQNQREQAEKSRIAETLDVEIKRWAMGKEGNLRALLSTLQYVLWPECGWQPVSLTDLITGASVKKVYRKATLCIHPDKVQQKGANLQQKYIAEKVFDLLKEAWNKFNSEELF